LALISRGGAFFRFFGAARFLGIIGDAMFLTIHYCLETLRGKKAANTSQHDQDGVERYFGCSIHD
jgi:hypothetical protein